MDAGVALARASRPGTTHRSPAPRFVTVHTVRRACPPLGSGRVEVERYGFEEDDESRSSSVSSLESVPAAFKNEANLAKLPELVRRMDNTAITGFVRPEIPDFFYGKAKPGQPRVLGLSQAAHRFAQSGALPKVLGAVLPSRHRRHFGYYQQHFGYCHHTWS